MKGHADETVKPALETVGQPSTICCPTFFTSCFPSQHTKTGKEEDQNENVKTYAERTVEPAQMPLDNLPSTVKKIERKAMGERGMGTKREDARTRSPRPRYRTILRSYEA